MACDLERLERLAKAATPLPWHKQSFDVYGWKNKRRVFIAQTSKPIMRGIENIAQRLKDADYIEAACNAAPELVARVRELERQRDYLAKLLGDLCTAQKDGQCPLFYNCPASNFGWSCGNAIKGDWIYAAEQAAKEAGSNGF